MGTNNSHYCIHKIYNIWILTFDRSCDFFFRNHTKDFIIILRNYNIILGQWNHILLIKLRNAPNELHGRSGLLLWHMTSILAWYLYLHYALLNRLYFSVFGGEGGIRTLAPVSRPTVLAGPPLIATWVPRHLLKTMRKKSNGFTSLV